MSKLFRVLTLLVFFGLGISCASAEDVNLSFNPQTVELLQDSSHNVQIVMDKVPEGGLSGFNITVSVLDPEIAEITSVSAPDWSTMKDDPASTSTVPSSYVWITGVNMNKINPGDTNVSLGNITITGKKVGTSDITIIPKKIEDNTENANPINSTVIQGMINVLNNGSDNESPVINSIILSNSQPYTGDSITVTVNATDNVGVSSVKANNISLLNQGGNIWNGSITVLEGTHSVNVSAEDVAGNVAWNNSTSYTAVTSNTSAVKLSFDPQTVELLQDSSHNVQIVMDKVPEGGLSGFNITVSVLDPEIAEITSVSAPDWSTMKDDPVSTSTVPSSYVWITGVNIDKINPGDTNVSLGNITITGKKVGTSDITIIPKKIEDNTENANPINSTVIQGMINVSDNESDLKLSIFKSVISPDEDGDCIVNSAGDKIPYRIVVKNEGKTNLTNITVKDPMIKLTGPTGDNNDSGVLDVGEIWVYTGVYKLTSDDINNRDYIENIATVSCNELSEISSKVETPIDKRKDLSIYKSLIGIDEAGDKKINKAGDIINYRIAVKNNGNVDLTGVSVSDLNVTLTKVTGNSNDTVLNSGELWEYRGNYTVTQNDIDTNGNGSGLIKNTATVKCSELDERSSIIVVPIIHTPSVVVTPETNISVVPLEANFSTNTTSGNAPLVIEFTDLSQNVDSRSWDFNNDGTPDSDKEKIVYTYATPGTYTAKLTVTKANETASKTATINVTKAPTNNGESGGKSSHSSGGSGRSGGSIGPVVSSTVTSTGKSNATGNATVTQAQNNTPIEQNNENTVVDVEQTPVQTNNTSTPAKESKKTPAFGIISGIICLSAVFLYKRR